MCSGNAGLSINQLYFLVPYIVLRKTNMWRTPNNSLSGFQNTLTLKNQNVRKGRLFGTPPHAKPQLGKHFRFVEPSSQQCSRSCNIALLFRDVQVSLNFPRFYITYWMSHSSDYGFRVISDGLNLLASLKLTLQAETESVRSCFIALTRCKLRKCAKTWPIWEKFNKITN